MFCLIPNHCRRYEQVRWSLWHRDSAPHSLTHTVHSGGTGYNIWIRVSGRKEKDAWCTSEDAQMGIGDRKWSVELGGLCDER